MPNAKNSTNPERVATVNGMTDKLDKAIATASRIRFAFVEATVAAKALEARHLCGPVAGAALGEAITAVALLSLDSASAEEAVMLRMNVSGPLGGVLVEATGEGALRGYSNRKVLDELDTRLPVDTTEALGKSGTVQIVTSTPGKILNQAVLNVNPPLMRYIVARYFNHSQQVPTACAIRVEAGSGGLISARGMLAQRMPDSDLLAFVRVLECFEGKHLAERLAEPDAFSKAWLERVGGVLALPDLRICDTRPLMFKCRCNRERVLAVLKTLTREELAARIDEGQDITCHMCGHTYSATPEEIRALLGQPTEA
jgi:molecular chaperone Hsp33